MGMFDWVNMPEPVKCPNCGAVLPDFQTKDGKEADAEMVDGFCQRIEVSEILEGGRVYSFCDSCASPKSWVEFEVKDGKLVEIGAAGEAQKGGADGAGR